MKKRDNQIFPKRLPEDEEVSSDEREGVEQICKNIDLLVVKDACLKEPTT